jgi:putative transposase
MIEIISDKYRCISLSKPESKGEYPTPSSEGNAIGVDLGITDFAIISTGSKYPNPQQIKKHESNLKRKQRKLSRKVKGSNSRNKARKLVARVHQRISNSRQDFLHKLVNENQVIVVEDLADAIALRKPQGALHQAAVKNMVRNHCLAKAISDCGWSSFVGMFTSALYLSLDNYVSISSTDIHPAGLYFGLRR